MSPVAKISFAVLASLAWSISAPAGLIHSPHRNSLKSCDCAPEFQPQCCRPQIVRPTRYHPPACSRRGTKPEACSQTRCDLDGCCPIVTTAPPVATCVPMELPCAPTATSIGCDDSCVGNGSCSELAELIHRSQTACHSWDRRDAVHKLSDRYSCRCHPEVMPALLYALNDPDERVRSKSADEIGDQLRDCPQCCSDAVLNGLKYALADCDRFVRRQAEEALRCAGFDLVDCVNSCDTACTSNGCISQVVTRNPIPPVAHAPENLVRNPSDDAAPVRTVSDSSVMPPPTEKGMSSDSSGALSAIFETPAPSADAPVPVLGGTSFNAAEGTSRRSQTTTNSRSFLRKQPLRQGLGNLFHSAK